jgi:hypothetical protein
MTTMYAQNVIDRLIRRSDQVAGLVEPETPQKLLAVPERHEIPQLEAGAWYVFRTAPDGKKRFSAPDVVSQYQGRQGVNHIFRSAAGWREAFTDYQLATTCVEKTKAPAKPRPTQGNIRELQLSVTL